MINNTVTFVWSNKILTGTVTKIENDMVSIKSGRKVYTVNKNKVSN